MCVSCIGLHVKAYVAILAQTFLWSRWVQIIDIIVMASLESLRKRVATSQASEVDAKKAKVSDTTSHTTPFKRKNASSDFGDLLSSPSKPENDQDDVTAGAQQTVEHGKQCLGCYRVVGQDSHMVCSNVPVVWFYQNGHGSFCRECGNLFRSLYKNRMTASLFEH